MIGEFTRHRPQPDERKRGDWLSVMPLLIIAHGKGSHSWTYTATSELGFFVRHSQRDTAGRQAHAGLMQE